MQMRVRLGLSIALGAAFIVAAMLASYSKGRDDALTSVSPAAPTPSAAPITPPSPPPTPAAPLTPIALGTADLGTVLFAETGIVWKFEASGGRLQALFATPSLSRGHAMTFDAGGQAGFLDARDPRSPLTPLSQRADSCSWSCCSCTAAVGSVRPCKG